MKDEQETTGSVVAGHAPKPPLPRHLRLLQSCSNITFALVISGLPLLFLAGLGYLVPTVLPDLSEHHFLRGDLARSAILFLGGIGSAMTCIAALLALPTLVCALAVRSFKKDVYTAAVCWDAIISSCGTLALTIAAVMVVRGVLPW